MSNRLQVAEEICCNPPPPDFERCNFLGSQTICHGQHVIPAEGGPTGIFCGSGPAEFEIVDRPDTLMGEVSYRMSVTYSDELAVPGDLGTAVETTIGVVNFVVPGHGAIARNAGRTVISFDGTVEFRAGPQAFIDYFVDGDLAALQPICDALAG